jgi:hypothetical protein
MVLVGKPEGKKPLGRSSSIKNNYTTVAGSRSDEVNDYSQFT